MTADVEPPRVRRRSYSQLSTYRDCPHCYLHKYVRRDPEQPAVWSLGGTSFHQCAEWFLSGDLGEQPDYPRIRNAWDVAWQIAEHETRERNPLAAELPLDSWRAADRGKETAIWWETAGPDMVRRFVDWKAIPGAGLHALHLEARLEVDFGGVPAVAIPDWIAVDEHGQVDIVDYKTGKPPKDSLQLGVYAAAIRRALGYEPAFGLYYMTRAGQLLPVHLDRWPDQLIVDLFGEFEQALQAERFDPDPTCRYCPCRKTKIKECM